MPSPPSAASKAPTIVYYYVQPLPQGLQWNSTYQTYTAPVAKLQTAAPSSFGSTVVARRWN